MRSARALSVIQTEFGADRYDGESGPDDVASDAREEWRPAAARVFAEWRGMPTQKDRAHNGRRFWRIVALLALVLAPAGCASQSEAWAHMRAGLVELRAAVRQHGELSRPAEGVHEAAWTAEAAAIDAAFAEGIAAAQVGAGEEVAGDE